MKILKRAALFATCSLLPAVALAGFIDIQRVPELDGGVALLALALVASTVAIIKERRRIK